MKGTIVKCVDERVTTRFGRESWEDALEEAGLDRATLILPVADVDDAVVMRIVKSVCKTLDLTLEQAADAFGDYWVNVYSQRMYGDFYKKHKNARDFLLDMNNVHVLMTGAMANAKPPRFTYEWKDGKTLIVGYQSHRGMVAFAVGLIKGVGKFYNQRLSVRALNDKEIEVVCPWPVADKTANH